VISRLALAVALLIVTACGSEHSRTRSADTGSGSGSACEAPCPEGTTRIVDEFGNVRCEPDEPPECGIDADCGEGAQCIDGCCIEPDDCQWSSECPSGQRCIEGTCIVDTCTNNEDCPSGEICLEGVCVVGNCDDDSDCPDDWHCAQGGPFLPGVCVQDGPCTETSCPAGYVCVDGECEEGDIPCDECPTGICSDGVCQPCPAAVFCADDDDACVKTACVRPDGGVDGGVADAGSDAGSGSDAATDSGSDGGMGSGWDGGVVTKDATVVARSVAYGGARKKSCKHKVSEPDPPKDGKKYSGVLTVWAIRTASDLWWGSPNQLAASTVVAYGSAYWLVWTGQAVLGHPIGHLQVEMSCSSDDGMHTISIPLTGQTGGGSEFLAAFEGAGTMLHEFPGWLDHKGPKYDDIKKDVATRKQSGRIAGMKFKLNDALCRHMWGYFNWYDTSTGPKHYGGQFRPQRREGSGCTAFGTSFVDRGGFLPRAFMVDNWARQLFIGEKRIGKILPPKTHPYGSNLVAWNAQGFQQWPKGQVVPAVGPIVPFSPVLNAWHDATEKQVPFTLFDAELVYKWIHGVWRNLDAGGADPMWKIDRDPANGNAKVIISDFSCDKRDKLPPYPDPEDDLRK
jgi:hypothetical protein